MFLQAYNLLRDVIQLGPRSDPLTLTTKEGRPRAPEHVKITPYGRYLNVSWKPPAEPNGVISGYVLRITNGTIVTVSGSTGVYLFKDLQPSTPYVVHINAKTSAGMGTTVSKVTKTTVIRGTWKIHAENRASLIRGTWAFDSKPSIQYASYSHQ
jgi:hypothetical protein